MIEFVIPSSFNLLKQIENMRKNRCEEAVRGGKRAHEKEIEKKYTISKFFSAGSSMTGISDIASHNEQALRSLYSTSKTFTFVCF